MLLSNSLLSSSPCSPFKLLPNSSRQFLSGYTERVWDTNNMLLGYLIWNIWTTYFSIHYHARLPCFNTQHPLLHSKLGMRVWEDLLPNHTGRRDWNDMEEMSFCLWVWKYAMNSNQLIEITPTLLSYSFWCLAGCLHVHAQWHFPLLIHLTQSLNWLLP